MSEHPPQEEPLTPVPEDMVPPPQSGMPQFQPPPAVSPQPVQVPEPSPGPPSAPVVRRRNPARTVLIIALATLLLAGAGAGVWWFFFRGNGGAAGHELLEGLREEPTVAWEHRISQETDIAGVPEGMLVAPDLSKGERELVMLDWADGSRKWAVDVSSEIRESAYAYLGTELPDGFVGVVIAAAEGERSLLVYRSSDGQFVKRLELGEGMLLMGESGALYQYEPLSSAIGQVKISRAKSIDDFDTKEWSVEVGIEPGDGQVKVLERNGHADFCLVGQSGEPGHCLLSLSTKDGSKPSWYQDNSSFIEVNGVIIASDADNNLTAYDEQGRRLWDQARASGALHVMGDALLVSENEAAAVERLDPRTGQSMWRADWYAGYFTGFQQDGKTVVAYTHPAFHAGVADLATGSVNLTEYPVEEPPRTMFRTADGDLILVDGKSESVKLSSVRPGEPGIRWTKGFDAYRQVEQRDKRLVLRDTDFLAVLR